MAKSPEESPCCITVCINCIDCTTLSIKESEAFTQLTALREKQHTDIFEGYWTQISGDDKLREFEQSLGDGEGQGNLACCSPWGRKESDLT